MDLIGPSTANNQLFKPKGHSEVQRDFAVNYYVYLMQDGDLKKLPDLCLSIWISIFQLIINL